MEVIGKVVAGIIQRRLQSLDERVLPKSLCGFRRGHDCTDMIFTIRQLTEKAMHALPDVVCIEHQAKQYFISVDLN